jgi:hypothetical protein
MLRQFNLNYILLRSILILYSIYADSAKLFLALAFYYKTLSMMGRNKSVIFASYMVVKVWFLTLYEEERLEKKMLNRIFQPKT